MGRRQNFHYGNDWNRVLSKKEIQNEKRFQAREARLRNTTSFYVFNLPAGCTRDKLWRAFDHFKNMEDVFVP
ncbi:putative nucleotide-binding alpha-beta plait domain superfamily, RNA-binding domain superfamily [Helianthus anomalus]